MTEPCEITAQLKTRAERLKEEIACSEEWRSRGPTYVQGTIHWGNRNIVRSMK